MSSAELPGIENCRRATHCRKLQKGDSAIPASVVPATAVLPRLPSFTWQTKNGVPKDCVVLSRFTAPFFTSCSKLWKHPKLTSCIVPASLKSYATKQHKCPPWARGVFHLAFVENEMTSLKLLSIAVYLLLQFTVSSSMCSPERPRKITSRPRIL